MNADQIAAIEARIQDCQTYKFGLRNGDKLAHEDAPALLALVREQAAKLESVRNLAARWHREYEGADKITDVVDRMDDEAWRLEDIVNGTVYAAETT